MMRHWKVFDDGFPNALDLDPQVIDFGDRAFVTDFFGPNPSDVRKEHSDEEVLAFLPTNKDRQSPLLASGLFGPSVLTVLMTKKNQESRSVR